MRQRLVMKFSSTTAPFHQVSRIAWSDNIGLWIHREKAIQFFVLSPLEEVCETMRKYCVTEASSRPERWFECASAQLEKEGGKRRGSRFRISLFAELAILRVLWKRTLPHPKSRFFPSIPTTYTTPLCTYIFLQLKKKENKLTNYTFTGQVFRLFVFCVTI